MSRAKALGEYRRNIEAAHQRIVVAMDAFIESLEGSDMKLKAERCQAVITATERLEAAIPFAPDRPHWLVAWKSGLKKSHQRFAAGQPQNGQAVRLLIEHVRLIRGESWERLAIDEEPAVDLDAIYAAYEKESRIPELLDLLIEQLEKISDSGQVDSISLRDRLEVLIQTLRKERSKGVAQRERLVRYSGWFLESLLFNLATLTPIQPLVDAVRETLDKIREEQVRLGALVEPKTKELFYPTVKSLPPGSVPEEQGEAGGLSESSHPETE